MLLFPCISFVPKLFDTLLTVSYITIRTDHLGKEQDVVVILHSSPFQPIPVGGLFNLHIRCRSTVHGIRTYTSKLEVQKIIKNENQYLVHRLQNDTGIPVCDRMLNSLFHSCFPVMLHGNEYPKPLPSASAQADTFGFTWLRLLATSFGNEQCLLSFQFQNRFVCSSITHHRFKQNCMRTGV